MAASARAIAWAQVGAHGTGARIPTVDDQVSINMHEPCIHACSLWSLVHGKTKDSGLTMGPWHLCLQYIILLLISRRWSR